MSDRVRYWFPVVAFVLFLAVLAFVVRPLAHGDTLDAKIAALKKQRADRHSVSPADPFAAKNPRPQDCGCLEGGRCTCGQTCGCTPAPYKAAVVESDQPGNPWVLYPDGSYYRYTKEQLAAYVPGPVAVPVRGGGWGSTASTSAWTFSDSVGGCSGGSWGTSRAFGRRR